MMNVLIKSTILLVGLAASGICQIITVCVEEDKDIRVDCIIEPKSNQINKYVFGMTIDRTEYTINTNATTEKVDNKFKNKSNVEQIGTNGFRLRLTDYPLSGNTTFTCKTNGGLVNTSVEKGKMLPCSAVSILLHTSPWLFYSLLSMCAARSWGLLPF